MLLVVAMLLVVVYVEHALLKYACMQQYMYECHSVHIIRIIVDIVGQRVAEAPPDTLRVAGHLFHDTLILLACVLVASCYNQ